MDVLGVIQEFFGDAMVSTILGMILLDVLLGIAAAIKAKQFEFVKVGDFYRTMVVPYIIGYLAFYLAARFFLTAELLGPWADLAGDGVQWIVWLALIGNLAASIIRSVRALGYSIEPDIDR